MAIVIPSKNIYSKSFDPVIDNNITSAEISVKENNFLYADEDVYSQNFNEFINISDKKIDWNGDFNIITPYWYWTFAGVECNAINKINVLINIPIEQNQKYVKKIFYGKGENGDSNIKFQIYGDITTENITGNVSNLHKENSNDWNENPTINIAGKTIKSAETDVAFDLPSVVEYTYKYEENQDYKKTIKVELDCTSLGLTQNENTILTAEPKNIVIDGKKYIRIQFSMLSSMNIIQWGSHYTQTTSTIPDTLNFDTAEKITYLSKVVEITVNGAVIKLNMEDKSITIVDGNNVFSFDGNELIQATNTPSIESKYQEIIDEWKNGEQTAVISCPIADYYSEELYDFEVEVTNDYSTGIRIINVYTETPVGGEQRTVVLFQPNERIEFCNNDSIILNCTLYNQSNANTVLLLNKSDYHGGNAYTSYFQSGAIPTREQKYNCEYSSNRTIIEKRNVKLISPNEENLPMTFHIGDIVIPYIYTNKGDKPLSYNKDFTPKRFKVVGNKISKKQGGTQELTLQEYNPHVINEIKIKLEEVLRGGDPLEIAYIQIFVIDGTVNVGDILVYKNEEAEVFSIEEDVIELRCETNGSFYNAIGETITVTKL